eukprot:CAMPEP_0179479728 /NCGR_PEP_ID=MMETSP0799-20121207/57913_1 /TAXON_ID=46947 /ORGANISM="Geminigera cryophila, Strain CCMP2564" /LENGTH=70 /DNA_ID=CAMNT_0021291539 /DNA_START=196 /DNA_END=408 /DNA_ORIENTATION=-
MCHCVETLAEILKRLEDDALPHDVGEPGDIHRVRARGLFDTACHAFDAAKLDLLLLLWVRERLGPRYNPT